MRRVQAPSVPAPRKKRGRFCVRGRSLKVLSVVRHTELSPGEDGQHRRKPAPQLFGHLFCRIGRCVSGDWTACGPVPTVCKQRMDKWFFGWFGVEPGGGCCCRISGWLLAVYVRALGYRPRWVQSPIYEYSGWTSGAVGGSALSLGWRCAPEKSSCSIAGHLCGLRLSKFPARCAYPGRLPQNLAFVNRQYWWFSFLNF